jgi:sugar lactone lactonase YvrE
MWRGVEEVFRAGDIVGESLVWDDRRRALVWVDIVGRRVHRFSPPSGKHELWPLRDFATSIGLCEDGRAILGLRRRIALWDYKSDPVDLVTVEPDLPMNRLNEGKVGPDGAFWVGTMVDNLKDDGTPKRGAERGGAIYRIASDARVTQLTERTFGLTNTLAWTRDDRLIVADTAANRIYFYLVNANTFQLDRRLDFAGPFGRGWPDGSSLDSDGYLWNCRVGGGACVVRYDPEGAIDRVVDLPCSSPTTCAFGDDDLGTLYVTSARFTMSAEHVMEHPHEGSVFAFRPGVKGLPEHRFLTSNDASNGWRDGASISRSPD